MIGWILGAGAAAAVAYAVFSEGGSKRGKRQPRGPGWYVLLYDQVGEGTRDPKDYDVLPNGLAARLKEHHGPFASKRDADIVAKQKRSKEGWRGKDVRVVVTELDESPW